MAIDLLPDELRHLYEVHEWKHACAVLRGDFPKEWNDIITVLRAFRLHRSAVAAKGGGLSPISRRLEASFADLDWAKKAFSTKVVVDDTSLDSPTHEVDCFKNRVAVEIEWNNKDTFFDRDLNNFRLLFDLRAVSVGVIITRSDELQEVFNELGKGSSTAASTTHMSKLLPRLEGGGGGGCPVLAFGITKRLYVED